MSKKENMGKNEKDTVKVPKHVGIIMDGNRRYSKKKRIMSFKGHEHGAKRIRDVLDWCREYGVKELTLFAFSMQNFNRPKKEFDYLMDLFRKHFDDLKKDRRINEYGIRINIIGRIALFPKDIQKRMREIMQLTKSNSNYIINFAMAYGGQEEIVDAAKKIAKDVKAGKLDIEGIDVKTFAQNLYIDDEPDVIIRTGGVMRTSNFLPYQSIYSELFFVDKMWPEFRKEDWDRIMKEYAERDRRFGGGSFKDYDSQ